MVEEAKAATESAGAIGALGLNWKLFLAQLVNFSIVLIIVWRGVYRPLLKILDERAKKIEQGLKDAEQSAVLRKTVEQHGENIILEARKHSETIMKEVEENAQRRREELLVEAKREVNKIIEEGRSQLHSEREQMAASVKAEVADSVVAAAEKILRAKIDRKKDEELLKESLKELV